MSRQWVSALVVSLFAVLAFFSFDHLTESPPTWFDEGIYLQAAMNDAHHGAQVLQIAPSTFSSTAFVTGGFPFLKPISWSFKLFGANLWHARLVMTLFIIGTAALFFLLMFRLFGAEISPLSLLLLVTFPPLYGQGKNALGEVPGLFYLAVFLCVMNVLEKRNYSGVWWYLLGGLAAGLCVSTKPIFFLLGGALLIALIVHRRTISFHWGQIAVGAITFLVPLSYWLFQQFGHGDTIAQVLGYYANPYDVQDLNGQILTNALRFVRESSPFYCAALWFVWMLSYATRIWKKIPVAVTETIALSFATLVLLAFLRTAGWYRYFFVAEIPALVFVPSALHDLYARYWKSSYAHYGTLVIVLMLVVIQSYQLLFTSWVAVHRARTTTADLTTYMKSLPQESSFFVYNVPAAVIFLPNENYYQYFELTPIKKLGTEYLALLSSATTDYVITDGRRWNIASTTLSHYEIVKTIDDLVIAQKKLN